MSVNTDTFYSLGKEFSYSNDLGQHNCILGPYHFEKLWLHPGRLEYQVEEIYLPPKEIK